MALLSAWRRDPLAPPYLSPDPDKWGGARGSLLQNVTAPKCDIAGEWMKRGATPLQPIDSAGCAGPAERRGPGGPRLSFRTVGANAPNRIFSGQIVQES